MTCPSCRLVCQPAVRYCVCGFDLLSAGSHRQPPPPPVLAVPTTAPPPLAAPAPPGIPQQMGGWCPKCKSFNPSASQFCGKCGAPMRKRASPVLLGCLGIVGVIVVLALIGSRSSSSVRSTSSEDSSNAPTSASPTPSAPDAPLVKEKVPVAAPDRDAKWIYFSNEDSMGRKRTFATTVSTNKLEFDFPYHGAQDGRLIIRKEPQSGTNVIIRIERGQFLCQFDGCNVNVRFDDGPIQRFSASGPDDHSTTSLFLGSETTFISRLRRSKKVRIESKFYQAGAKTLEFDVDGFNWKP